MIFWPRYIGSWKAKTAGLSATQKGVYGEMLDFVYSAEQPLPNDHAQIYRIAGAITREECKAVDYVLRKLWQKTDSGYVNPRTMEEIAKWRENVAKKQRAARIKWDKERAK